MKCVRKLHFWIGILQTIDYYHFTLLRIFHAVTFMFHRFFSSLARSMYWSLISLSFSFNLWSARTTKSTIQLFFVFVFLFFFFLLFFTVMWSCHLTEMRWTFVSQNPRERCVSHFPGWMLGCAYTICSYSQI